MHNNICCGAKYTIYSYPLCNSQAQIYLDLVSSAYFISFIYYILFFIMFFTMESPLLHLIYHLVSISTSKHGEVCYSARLVVGQAVTYPKYMDVYIFDLARND